MPPAQPEPKAQFFQYVQRGVSPTHFQKFCCKLCIIPKDFSEHLNISNQAVFWCDKCYFLPHWKQLWRMTDQLGMGLGRRGSLPQKKNQGRRKLMSPTSANQNMMSAAKKERKHTFIDDLLLCNTNNLYQNKLYVWKDELRADIQTLKQHFTSTLCSQPVPTYENSSLL